MAKKKAAAGIRRLSPEDDLYSIFAAADENEAGESPERFAELLEESFSCNGNQDLLREKKENLDGPARASIRDELKSYPPPEDELDLHGFSAEQAASRAESFLLSARQRSLKTVRIIVGKGHHSGGRAVLREVIEGLAVTLKRRGRVLTFAWEKKEKLRSGSIIIYL